MTYVVYADNTAELLYVKYYVATETHYLDNLHYAVSRQSSRDLSANAMLILGNSYILSTIALLPETITALYHCDIDDCILGYAQELIKIANDASCYDDLKNKLYPVLDGRYHFVNNIISEYYNNDKDRFISERVLSEPLFDAYKEKINRISIHYSVIDLFSNKQVAQLTQRINNNQDKIGLFSISNIIQFDSRNCLRNTFFNHLSKHGASIISAPVLYSWFNDPKSGQEPRPESKVLRHTHDLMHLKKFLIRLTALGDKVKELNHRGYTSSADILKELHHELLELSRRVDDVAEFSKTALKKITAVQKHPELNEHRGSMSLVTVILNSLIHLCTFGLAYGVTGKLFLFAPPTDSVSKLQHLGGSLAIAPAVFTN